MVVMLWLLLFLFIYAVWSVFFETAFPSWFGMLLFDVIQLMGSRYWIGENGQEVLVMGWCEGKICDKSPR